MDMTRIPNGGYLALSVGRSSQAADGTPGIAAGGSGARCQSGHHCCRPGRGLLTASATPAPASGLPSGQRLHIPERRFADASERRAAEVPASVGAEIAAEGPGNQPGHPDLSAWFSDLPNWANPVIVEVKARDLGGGSHSGAVQQLRGYLHDLGLSIGIVLVPGERSPVWESEEGTAIMLLGVETLAELGPQGARNHLIRARNLIAHSA